MREGRAAIQDLRLLLSRLRPASRSNQRPPALGDVRESWQQQPRPRMMPALDLVHGVRVDLTNHGFVVFPGDLTPSSGDLDRAELAIFSQDPLRASDKALTSSGPYMMKEENANVYRGPYLVSGSAGFALNAITRALGKDLKGYIESMRTILASDSWNTKTTICWGMRDRWLAYDGVANFCDGLKYKFEELPMAGHHAQEDRGEELGNIIKRILR